MSKELWKKCANTDYNTSLTTAWVKKYIPELSGTLMTLEDASAICVAIDVLESIKLKYK